MFLQLGVIYAVILAFIFSFMLNNINDAYTDVKQETTSMLSLSQLASGFPPAMHQEIDQTLINYTRTIINDEWPKMAERKESSNASKLLKQLQKIYIDYNPKQGKEEIIYTESLQHLMSLREHRRMRIFTATEFEMKRPWIYLGLLGGIVVGISYFFGMKDVAIQMLLTAALIFTISSILTLMIMISHPFEGPYAIKPRVFENTLMRLEQISQE